MKAVGVVEATCEEIFELVMSMDGTRFEQVFSFYNVYFYFYRVAVIACFIQFSMQKKKKKKKQKKQ